MDTISTTVWIVIAAVAAVAVVGIATQLMLRKRRTEMLRAQFGPEYAREIELVRDQRRAEGKLQRRIQRVEHFNIRPLTPRDRMRFVDSWRIVQARFVENPGSAVSEADTLLGDVMATRGYPVADFEQRAADLSVDHPHVVQNYRAAHTIALMHARGQATTEELRQALIHYRALLDEIISEPETVHTRMAS